MVRGKKVAVVGRFPDLDAFNDVCRLIVLERNPGEGDLPDPACEYVLPEQDFVFITATTIINKTMPTAPGIEPQSVRFPCRPQHALRAAALRPRDRHYWRVRSLSKPESVWQAAQEGAARSVFDHGAQMVKVNRKNGGLKG